MKKRVVAFLYTCLLEITGFFAFKNGYIKNLKERYLLLFKNKFKEHLQKIKNLNITHYDYLNNKHDGKYKYRVFTIERMMDLWKNIYYF